MTGITFASYIHLYREDGWNIQFSKNDKGELSVTIETDDLKLRTIEESDLPHYVSLYGNQDVMGKLLTGAIRTPEETAGLVHKFVETWKSGSPYSHMPVFEKATDCFLGSMRLSANDPGIVELSGLGHKNYWNRGYGTRVVSLVLNGYGSCLQREEHLVKGAVLRKVIATAQPSNVGSCAVLKKIGMTFVRTEEKYGAPRSFYEIMLPSL